jgi:hypothetical protein
VEQFHRHLLDLLAAIRWHSFLHLALVLTRGYFKPDAASASMPR